MYFVMTSTAAPLKVVGISIGSVPVLVMDVEDVGNSVVAAADTDLGMMFFGHSFVGGSSFAGTVVRGHDGLDSTEFLSLVLVSTAAEVDAMLGTRQATRLMPEGYAAPSTDNVRLMLNDLCSSFVDGAATGRAELFSA